MESSPSNSLEKQIDNFLEHFKRSASKAMEAEWCSSSSSSVVAATNITAHHAASKSMATTPTSGHPPALPAMAQHCNIKTRSSCMDISEISG